MKEKEVDFDNEAGVCTEIPEASPQEAPPTEQERDEYHGLTSRQRWFAICAAVLLILGVVLAISLPITLKNDDDGSRDDHAGQASIDESLFAFDDALEIEPLMGEANALNYRNASELESDLTRVLQDHVQFFIKNQHAPFECWNPWTWSDTTGPSDTGTMAPTEGGFIDDEMGGEDAGEKDDITDYATNNQEMNIDEADTMKADVNFIYAAYGNHLVVWDRNGKQVSSLAIVGDERNDPRHIRALLITDSFLVVIVDARANDNDFEDVKPTKVLNDYLSTQIRLYERNTISGDLRLAASKSIHGTYVNARSIGDTVYLQTQSCLNIGEYLWYYMPDQELSETEAAYSERVSVAGDSVVAALREKLQDELKQTNGDVPTVLRLGSLWKETDGGDFLSHLTQVTTFNTKGATNETSTLRVSASVILGQSSFPFLYATKNKLVLADTRHAHAPYYEGNLTHLVALEMDSSQTRFLSLGTVEGELLNSYALDLVGNSLRAATTVDRGWVDGSESRTMNLMTVLEVTSHMEGRMLETGQVKIGKPNERIMSVRFFDNIAYAVTYEQTDPFYVVDMDVPRILGELSLPGFSSYLHSMNANNTLLVAVGWDEDKGLVVTVFDATDPSSPKPVAQNHFGRKADSTARWQYKAFRFVGGKAIIPIYDSRRFDGFVVIDVSTAGVTEDYRVSHSHKEGTCGHCFDYGGQRSFVFSGDLMTVKNGIVVSTDFDSGEEIWRLHLTLAGETHYCCW